MIKVSENGQEGGQGRGRGKTRQDKTRQLYLTRVAESAARLVSLVALGSIKLTCTHLQ